MGRIKGHYEWDDEDLTPGHKKEGGLHQNLFDGGGKLRGSARFIPDDGSEPEPLIITETVYLPTEQRRTREEQEEFEEAVAKLVSDIVDLAKPHVEQWWRESARPVIDARRAKMAERRARRKARKSVIGALIEPSQQLAPAFEADKPEMARAEAQARYLAALAARAYSDEQLRLVSSAHIVDSGDFAELARSMAELPSEQVRELIEAMVMNPSMLGEDALAQLASVLGRRALNP